MLERLSVKKPYTVIVGIIIVIMLGVISFTRMSTDLLPSMNFPYVIVYTTYVGATPEQIEDEIARPMEAEFATLTNIKKITSRSSDNLGLVVLQFNDGTDMNTAMIEINSAITTLSSSWSDDIGSPAIMQINPDMLPVSIVSVSRDDMDLVELSDYVEDTLIPEYEGINGVAKVTASGAVTQEVDITIEQDLIDVLNSAVLRELDSKLADTEKQLDDAQAQLRDGRGLLARQRKLVSAQFENALLQLDQAEAGMPGTIEGLRQQRAGLQAQLDQAAAGLAQLEPMVTMSEKDRAKLAEYELKLATLRGQRESLEQELSALSEGSAVLLRRQEAIAQRDELQAERATLLEYIETAGGSSEELNADIAEVDEQLRGVRTALSDAEVVLNAARQQQRATQSRISELEQLLGESAAQPTPTSEAAGEAESTATVPPSDGETPSPTVETTPAIAGESATAVPEETAEVPEQTAEAETKATDVPEDTKAEATAEPAPAAAERTAEPEREAAPTTEKEKESSTEETTPRLAWASGLMPVAYAEEATREQLREELEAARAALIEEQQRADTAQAMVTSLKEQEQGLEARRAELVEALEGAGGSTEGQLEAARRKVESLDSRIKAVEDEIAELEHSGGDMKKAAKLQSEIDSTDASIAKIAESESYKALASQDPYGVNGQYTQLLQGKAQLEAGIAQLDTTIGKLEQGIIPGGMIEGIAEDTTIDGARQQIRDLQSTVSAAFGEASRQMREASDKLAEARKTFEDKRDEAYENAGLDGIITVDTVAAILGAQNMSMPAGYVYDVSDDEYLVRIGDKYTTLAQLRDTRLFELGMDTIDEVRLYDVATVHITDDSEDSFTKVDGRDGILLSIEKQSIFSTTDVAKLVEAKTAELTAKDPSLRIVDMFNQGDYITIVVDSVLQNLIYGGILAVLVLLLFLWDFRPTIIIAFSIPLSVVAAFVCMYFTGVTLNVLSLSGLALGIGMLVDNSIVSIENIYRLRDEEGMPILKACVEGVHQVGGALFASTLTTIAVFLPIVFVSGMAHDLFKDIGLTIAYSLLASLVVAMTVVPSMAASLLKKPKKKKKKGSAQGGVLFGLLQRGYVLLLRGALHVKPLVLLAVLAAFVLTALQVPSMSMSFMPEVNSDQMEAKLEIDTEGDVEAQQDRAVALMDRIMRIPGIDSVGLTGGAGTMSMMSSSSDLTYYIIVDTSVGRKNVDIAEDIRAVAAEEGLSDILSVQTSTMDISMMIGSGITVNVFGDDIETLRATAKDVAAIASGIEGTCDISDGLERSVPELRITVDKEQAISHHLTVGQVLQFVAKKLYGKAKISSAELDGKTLDIYLIDQRNAEITPETLMDLEIEVTSGDTSELVRIGDVAELTETESMASISREGQRRKVAVTFDAADGYSLNHISDEFERRLAEYQLPSGITVELSGENESVMEIMKNLIFMVAIAIALIFLIMVAQFQSFKSPIIVMFTIPLAFTGGLLALLLMHMDLSIVAMVGFLVLSGVIVNNGIVFVDCVNQLRIGGMSKREALLETGRLRLRPILMTALTTILGMSTMALGSGMGAEMMQPMAVVTIGGLVYATLMTLFVVPCLYDLFNGKRMHSRQLEAEAESSVHGSAD